MFLWNQKKIEDTEYIVGLQSAAPIQYSNSLDILLPITNALIAFFLVAGSFLSYVSCFTTEYNLPLLLGGLLLLSFLIAFVNYLRSGLLKDLIYIVFLFGFVVLMSHFYAFVNSGYHAIVNLSYASLENYLDIPALIHYNEVIEDPFRTITVFGIFYGFFLLLLVQIWLKHYVRLYSILLLINLPLIIPFFVSLYPDTIYVAFLLIGIFAVILQHNSTHVMPGNRKKRILWTYRKGNPWKHHTPGYSYTTNGLTYFATLVAAIMITIISLMVVSITVPYARYSSQNRTSNLKENLKEGVAYFVTFGLSGYFNEYSNVGGLNSGRLGGVSSVRPDYQTDLIVRMVPTSYEPLYLRGFVGIAYSDRQWYDYRNLVTNHIFAVPGTLHYLEDVALSSEYESLKDTAVLEQDLLLGSLPQEVVNKELSSTYRIEITNVGMADTYSYTPYYADPYDYLTSGEDSVFFELLDPEYSLSSHGAFSPASSRTYEYYAYSPYATNYHTEKKHLDAFLFIPGDTRDEIVTFLQGEEELSSYIVANNIYAERSHEEVEQIVTTIGEIYERDFTYSLNPGLTPKRKDFAGYFLNETKEGYCSYFATGATLMLRTMGIPARYVEGYVVTYDDISNHSTIVEGANFNDYLPDTMMSSPSLASVLDVSVTDYGAHAWVEYYDPDFGWRVFEATTANRSDLETNTDFWSALYQLLGQQDDASASGLSDGVEGSDNKKIESFVIYFVIVLLILLCLGVFGFYGLSWYREYRSYHRNFIGINVRNYYKMISRKISKRYHTFAYLVTFQEQLDFILAHYQLKEEIFTAKNTESLRHILELAAFSHDGLTNLQGEYAMKLLKLIHRKLLLGPFGRKKGA